MKDLCIHADTRCETGKGASRRIRAIGGVPAILYGQGEEATSLKVNRKELKQLFVTAGGTSALFDLAIEGQGQKIPVMVKDYQVDVLSRDFLHVDFFRVNLSEKVTVEVPIHFIGEAPGVKEGGGILEHIARTIEVICLPTAIPEALNVDVSHLNIGDNLHVHDLQLPEGVELLPGSDETIAIVVAPTEEKVEEVAVVEGDVAADAKAAAEGTKDGKEAKEGKGTKDGKEVKEGKGGREGASSETTKK